MNTGESPKRTTAGTELCTTAALGAGAAEALDGGATGTALALGGAPGASVGVGAAGAGGAGATASGSGTGAGSGVGAASEAEGTGAAETRADDAAGGKGRPETTGAGGENGAGGEDGEDATEALPTGPSAHTRPGANSPMAKQSAMRRNQSPQTRADVHELTLDLTLGLAASVTGLATASTNARG
ncbi:MAG TPA: hypothetical protein VJV79_26425 [Polyangiaceae bacterium]|nr:hypothetical protein [Polyangiaceae bacterium]